MDLTSFGVFTWASSQMQIVSSAKIAKRLPGPVRGVWIQMNYSAGLGTEIFLYNLIPSNILFHVLKSRGDRKKHFGEKKYLVSDFGLKFTPRLARKALVAVVQTSLAQCITAKCTLMFVLEADPV